MADMEYRMAIAQKIRRNVTRGTVEDTIDSLKFVFDAPIIFLHESGNANIAVAVGRILKPYEIHVANAMDLVIRPGGVNLKYKSFFNYNHYFGFEGQLNSKGFSKGQFAEVF